MKGNTKIQLFREGKEVKCVEEHNEVTTLVEQLFNKGCFPHYNNAIKTLMTKEGYCIEDYSSIFKLDNVGLELRNEHVDFKNKKSAILCQEVDDRREGYAFGDSPDLFPYNKGWINTEETQYIVEDGKTTGVRYVYDFTENSLSAEIKCVSLRLDFGGSSTSSIAFPAVISDNPVAAVFETDDVESPTNAAGKVIASYDYYGIRYEATETGYRYFNLDNAVVGFHGFDDSSYIDVTIDGYSNFAKPIVDDYKNKVLIIGEKEEGKYLLTLDKATNVLEEEELLESVNFEFADWAFLEEYVIFMQTRESEYVPNVIKAYDRINKKEQSNNLTISYGSVPSPSERSITYNSRLSTLIDAEGRYYVLVSGMYVRISNVTSSPYTLCMAECKMATTDKTNGALVVIGHGPETRYDKARMPFYHLNGTCGSIFGGCYFPADYNDIIDDQKRFTNLRLGTEAFPGSVLTINNLDEPILKTNADSMKITYELRW